MTAYPTDIKVVCADAKAGGTRSSAATPRNESTATAIVVGRKDNELPPDRAGLPCIVVAACHKLGAIIVVAPGRLAPVGTYHSPFR